MRSLDLDDREKARLTTWMVEQRMLGIERPELRVFYQPKDDKLVNNIELIIQRPSMAVHARADELLKYIRKKSPYIGYNFELSPIETNPNTQKMEMLAYTESVVEAEVAFLRDYLLESERIKYVDGLEGHTVTITLEGYARLAEMEQVVTESSRAFVAMWLDDSVLSAYTQGIKPAIEKAGYEAIRIDKRPHLNKIDDQIIAEIKRSRFVIADFTHGDDGARGSVYYEAGFAHGLRIPVIFTCRKDIIERIHFDTRQYPHIVWEDHAELRKSLTDRIWAVIGEGPNSLEIGEGNGGVSDDYHRH